MTPRCVPRPVSNWELWEGKICDSLKSFSPTPNQESERQATPHIDSLNLMHTHNSNPNSNSEHLLAPCLFFHRQLPVWAKGGQSEYVVSPRVPSPSSHTTRPKGLGRFGNTPAPFSNSQKYEAWTGCDCSQPAWETTKRAPGNWKPSVLSSSLGLWETSEM